MKLNLSLSLFFFFFIILLNLQGLIGGVFPIPGTTSLVCMLIIFIFKLNLPACQLANLLCTPLELFLIVPYIRLGEVLFMVQEPLPLSTSDISSLLSTESISILISMFGVSLLRAIVSWALSGLLLFPILYYSFRFILSTKHSKRWFSSS